MTRSIFPRLALVAALALAASACEEEGRAEKAGRKFDEAIEKLQHGDEGALEKAGRKLDEGVEELREGAAEAVEGDD
jgi:cell division protein ZapA (FtsZ GTPase activity inhibitor)